MLTGVSETQDAIANGDTRTLTIYHTHTKEAATITFKRYGSYDREAIKQLCWLLRDWRRDEPTSMDPRLFDLIWEVYRETGSREAIHVVSAYRSPTTNAMLRRRSRAVAEHSQHMLGKAMDFYLPDVRVDRIRAIGVRLQRGGVGFYPTAYNPFIHLDVASVRAWPRLTHDQLAQIFPDGKTVHIPTDGQPLAGYEQARAEILARGGTVAGVTAYADSGESAAPQKSFWARLFGGSDESEDVAESRIAPAPAPRAPVRTARDVERTAQQVAFAQGNATGGDAGLLGFFSGNGRPAAAAPQPVAVEETASDEDTAGAPRALSPLQRTAAVPPDVAKADVQQTASTVPTLAPLPIARPAMQLPSAAQTASGDETAAIVLASMRLPPPRPADLAPLPPAAAAVPQMVAEAQAPATAPLPPVRPAGSTSVARKDDGSAAALAALAAGARLPPSRPGSALAYTDPTQRVPPPSIRPLPVPAAPLPNRLANAYNDAVFASDTVRGPETAQANGLSAAALIANSRRTAMSTGSLESPSVRQMPLTLPKP